jgi:hypothetical protein
MATKKTKMAAMILIPHGCLLDFGTYGSNQVRKNIGRNLRNKIHK